MSLKVLTLLVLVGLTLALPRNKREAKVIPQKTVYTECKAASIDTEAFYGTTAGLGYLEVLELSMQILLLGQLASVRTVDSQWGRRIQFLC
jgi:hypothetical protein